MSKVVTLLSPKTRFQESGDNISKHREMLQSREFERAIDWGLLQYSKMLCDEPGDLNQCASKHLRMQGAHEFVRVMFNLAESPVAALTNDIMNLDHRANK